jgi:type IV conjugative transfer system protein TraL
MQYFTVFHHLDEPKRYAGATLLEIVVVGTIVFAAFILQRMAIGLFISLVVFRLVRAISRSSKVDGYKRWLCFHYQDLKAGPNRSRRFFF